MSDHIDYYFSAPSPFAFLGHKALTEMAGRHNKKINFKPFNLASVFSNSGAVMPGDRPMVRQRYRFIELKRVAHLRGVALNAKPKHFPVNPTLADHCICTIVEKGEDAANFIYSLGEALWVKELDIADEAVITSLLDANGHDAKTVLSAANGDGVAAIRQQNTEDAVAADAVGAPAYVYNGEVFWGQDRVDHLEEMISSNRAPFTV